MIKLHETPYQEGLFPLQELCSSNELPHDASVGFNVDWSGVRFASISLAVAVAAIQLCGKHCGVRQSMNRPHGDAETYMSRMNYYASLDIDVKETFERHETLDRFVPIIQIPIDELCADVNGAAQAVGRLLANTMSLPPGSKRRIDYSVGEIVDNIVQHSFAASPGLVGAQHYPSRGFADICFADCGIGIVQSMRENPSYSSIKDETLLLKAFEHGTGQWYGNPQYGTNMVSGGEGLADLSELVGRLGGHVWVVSHGHAATIDREGIHLMNGMRYPGTVIVMRVPNCGTEFPDWEASVDDSLLPYGDLW